MKSITEKIKDGQSTKSPSRAFLYIFLPQWSVDVVRIARKEHAERPLILSISLKGQAVVGRLCHRAHGAGVKLYMPIALVRAIAPKAEIIPFDAHKDLLALFRLAQWLSRISPLVAIDKEITTAAEKARFELLDPFFYGLIVDLRGMEKIHGNEEVFLNRLKAKFQNWGISARLAVAKTVGAAWALGHFSPKDIISLKEDLQNTPLSDSIAALPLKALRIPDNLFATLNRLGIVSVGALFNLPRQTLSARFGSTLLERMAELTGEREEILNYISLPKQLIVKRTFEHPLYSVEIIVNALEVLFEELLKKLNFYHKSAGSFLLLLFCESENGALSEFGSEITLFQQHSSQRHLREIIQPLVEKLGEQRQGSVRQIQIEAKDLQELQRQQHNLFSQEADKKREHFEELINHLVVRCGADHVAQITPIASYKPEKAFAYTSVIRQSKNSLAKNSPAKNSQEFRDLKNRPTQLLSPPQPLRVISMLPDYRPLWIEWRGEKLRILESTAAERISEEWWNLSLGAARDLNRRDYFRVQVSSGIWIWIFRDSETNAWFVHGVWL